MMTKQFTSVITVEFAYNNHEANSKEDYIDLLKRYETNNRPLLGHPKT